MVKSFGDVGFPSVGSRVHAAFRVLRLELFVIFFFFFFFFGGGVWGRVEVFFYAKLQRATGQELFQAPGSLWDGHHCFIVRRSGSDFWAQATSCDSIQGFGVLGFVRDFRVFGVFRESISQQLVVTTPELVGRTHKTVSKESPRQSLESLALAGILVLTGVQCAPNRKEPPEGTPKKGTPILGNPHVSCGVANADAVLDARSPPCLLTLQRFRVGGLGFRVLGFLGFWVFGFLGFWVFGFLGFWVFGFLGFWVFGFLGFWVFGFLGFWVFGFLVFGFLGFGVFGFLGLGFWVLGFCWGLGFAVQPF